MNRTEIELYALTAEAETFASIEVEGRTEAVVDHIRQFIWQIMMHVAEGQDLSIEGNVRGEWFRFYDSTGAENLGTKYHPSVNAYEAYIEIMNEIQAVV